MDELLLERERLREVWLEDGVAVVVARSVLLVAERGPGDPAGC